MSERERFEAWWQDKHSQTAPSWKKQDDWETWQAALAQRAEPVAWHSADWKIVVKPEVRCIWPDATIPLYAAPQPAQRKPLTEEQIMGMYSEPCSDAEMIEFARAIEAAHGIWKEKE